MLLLRCYSESTSQSCIKHVSFHLRISPSIIASVHWVSIPVYQYTSISVCKYTSISVCQSMRSTSLADTCPVVLLPAGRAHLPPPAQGKWVWDGCAGGEGTAHGGNHCPTSCQIRGATQGPPSGNETTTVSVFTFWGRFGTRVYGFMGLWVMGF